MDAQRNSFLSLTYASTDGGSHSEERCFNDGNFTACLLGTWPIVTLLQLTPLLESILVAVGRRLGLSACP